MGLDIRLPIGLMFLILGALLVFYGFLTFSDAAVYSRSLGANVNLWWGLCLLIFGALMLFFGRRATVAGKIEGMREAANSVEGERTEELERERRLES